MRYKQMPMHPNQVVLISQGVDESLPFDSDVHVSGRKAVPKHSTFSSQIIEPRGLPGLDFLLSSSIGGRISNPPQQKAAAPTKGCRPNKRGVPQQRSGDRRSKAHTPWAPPRCAADRAVRTACSE